MSRVLKSDCPFCLLACEATLLYRNLNAFRFPLSPDKDVEVVWHPETVARTRGGFVMTSQEDVKLQNVNVFLPRGDFIGRDGLLCGRLPLDGFDETTFFDPEGPFEVILLSESRSDDHDPSMPLATQPKEWNSYHVMVIEWHGKVAEWRGLGTVLKSAVHQSFSPGPVWKEIVLG
ncbi:hypothetical protein B0T16DRAFT_420727 [Cercophora newfieldiana]|uniref:Uncharacterized protein n=1 Tax=Cercophora newfieldiana TaxID=92897 RepID=A0AA40CKN4_9PEZI|nr:hypothetical protein B0T16DRAFT_420727 [Cercophora newfieldiana]